MKKTVEISGGGFCPKCKELMQRVKHGPNWKPKDRQPYYFAYWDKCRNCRHMQHYEIAKVLTNDQTGRMAKKEAESRSLSELWTPEAKSELCSLLFLS